MATTDRTKEMKIAAGEAAALRIRSGMVVGLGTGSTTVHAIRRLGRRLRDGEIEGVRGVPTSFEARLLAREVGIPLVTLDEIDRIDVAIDGADEVDPKLALIKGGGAAHTAEKVVDALADEFIVVIDEGKLVDRLGSQFAVPVEVLPFALAPVTRALERLGGRPELRMGARKAGPVVSDHGNLVVDVRFDEIPDPAGLGTRINDIPGVVEHGLFVGLASRVLVGAIEGGAPVVRELLPPAG